MSQPPKPSPLKKYGWLAALLVVILLGGLYFLFRPGTEAGLSEILPPKAPSSAPFVPTSTASFEGILRLAVREPGLYALSWDVLSENGLQGITPDQLRLYNLGQPQTLWYSKDGDTPTIYFYGRALNSPYTAENVYFLTTADNTLPSTPSPGSYPLLEYSPVLHLEDNLVYLPKAEPEHTWFWKTLTAPTTETLEFNLPALPPGEATIRLSVFANTEASNLAPDHHLLITLNNTLLADRTWDGRGSQLIEETLSTDRLQQGTNTLVLELPGDTGAIVETLLLDWIEIDYPSAPVAENTRAGFHGTGNDVELTGFPTPPLVFDLTLAGDGVPREITPPASLQIPTQPNHLYLAVAPDGFLTPTSIFPAQLSPTLSSAQADYIAIGPPDLLEPLQPLLNHHTSNGLTTLAVPIYAIYDQFGGGVAHPEAIRTYLKFARENWPTPPKYVLLVGDSTYDPHGYQFPPEINRVPSYFRFTYFGGETISDTAFAQLDDDNLPDLIIGRIPAQTPEQVAILVQKTLAYAQNPPSERTHHILAIADGQEASFKTDAETFLSYFPAEYTPILLTPPKGDTTAPAQITRILDEGVLFMAYFGHGSITMLGKDRIFSVEDGEALKNNERLPIMINITCLAGLFTHPEVDSLTEVMLWNPDGGAVAALSATSLTVPADQAHLTQAFVQALSENPDATLGELLLMAQRLIPVQNEGAREVMDTFLLFGDPALKLP